MFSKRNYGLQCRGGAIEAVCVGSIVLLLAGPSTHAESVSIGSRLSSSTCEAYQLGEPRLVTRVFGTAPNLDLLRR